MSILRAAGPYAVGCLSVCLVFFALKARSARKRGHLPPGPKPLPVIGNLLDLPHSEEWLTWQAYVERYGDLVYVTALGRKYLLVGSYEAMIDLFEKRAHFNDRPQFTMLGKLMDLGWLLPIIPYGAAWRRGRKIMHSQTHAVAMQGYQPVQIRGARRFVGDLLAAEQVRPADRLSEAAKAFLPRMVRLNFAFTAVNMIYGIDVRDAATEARYVGIPERVLHAFSEGSSPGRFFVDLIPLLKCVPSWFPGANFQVFAKETASLGKQTRDNAIEVVKRQMATEAGPVTMAAEMLKSYPNDEQMVKDIAGAIYLAGSDTTVAAVTSYFLAMVCYPEVQRRAQEELDRVIGRGRFPDFSDREDLPYFEAVIRECLRWLPVVPVSMAHVSTQDDEYRGFFIPKGTLALPFQWGLLHDGATFPEPSTFSPERYLIRMDDGHWKLRDDVVDPRKFAFGFGRRICPGKHVAEQSLFAMLTTVMHTIEVMRVKDSHGQEVIPDARMSSGLLCHPLPFAYELRKREDSQHLVDVCVALAGHY